MSHFEQKEAAVLPWLEQLTLGLDLPQPLMLGLWRQSCVVLILGIVSGSIRWWFPPWWTTWRRGWLWTASTSWTTSIRFPEYILSFYGSYRKCRNHPFTLNPAAPLLRNIQSWSMPLHMQVGEISQPSWIGYMQAEKWKRIKIDVLLKVTDATPHSGGKMKNKNKKRCFVES